MHNNDAQLTKKDVREGLKTMLRKPLLTTHEVAELLQIKEATVRKWIRDGELSAVSLGRDWRVAVIQLEEFVKLRMTGRASMQSSAQFGVLRSENGETRVSGAQQTNRKRRQSTKGVT